ncbi:36.4 kDa proline-rich protein-like [Panicum miliaceum]|uniref:36.4 kDa proline-rich protein-like n=1 Tax=Panicum miliaceum TaxID=4540 RepID=A0A3L6PE05_PANMI|nr:36.4 kDa proline-rich protein-like [Panicum miliaceum]
MRHAWSSVRTNHDSWWPYGEEPPDCVPPAHRDHAGGAARSGRSLPVLTTAADVCAAIPAVADIRAVPTHAGVRATIHADGQASEKCCPLLKGMADLDAAFHLCITIKAMALPVSLVLPIAIEHGLGCLTAATIPQQAPRRGPVPATVRIRATRLPGAHLRHERRGRLSRRSNMQHGLEVR